MVRYSTPFSVEEITDIKDVIACFKELFWIFITFVIILKVFSVSILNMSLRINSYTKFFLSSGAICNAFTLNDNKTSTKLSILLSLRCFKNFCLCSYITVSPKSSLPSSLPSFITILWYLPN